MARHNIFHDPGSKLNPATRETLGQYFSESQLDRLEHFGGRISIVISAPYTKRSKSDPRKEIGPEFVSRLREISNSKERVQEELRSLRVRELRMVADLLGQPVPSDSAAGQIRTILLKSLQSGQIWQKISRSPTD